MTHAAKSGVAHFACETEVECLQTVRALLQYLPSNNQEDPPVAACRDDVARADARLDSLEAAGVLSSRLPDA